VNGPRLGLRRARQELHNRGQCATSHFWIEVRLFDPRDYELLLRARLAPGLIDRSARGGEVRLEGDLCSDAPKMSIVSLSNPIIPGQSFSVVSGSGFGPPTVANGAMGAGYGGPIDPARQARRQQAPCRGDLSHGLLIPAVVTPEQTKLVRQPLGGSRPLPLSVPVGGDRADARRDEFSQITAPKTRRAA
jgi:hypothetical protein